MSRKYKAFRSPPRYPLGYHFQPLAKCKVINMELRLNQGNKKRGAPLISLGESRFSVSPKIGGEEEIRTLDPHVANVMLYQLSYFPIRGNGV